MKLDILSSLPVLTNCQLCTGALSIHLWSTLHMYGVFYSHCLIRVKSTIFYFITSSPPNFDIFMPTAFLISLPLLSQPHCIRLFFLSSIFCPLMHKLINTFNLSSLSVVNSYFYISIFDLTSFKIEVSRYLSLSFG